MKKGFTLMELLATIIILAVIVLITTPIIANTINGAQQKAVIISAQAYVRAINDQIISNQTKYLTLKNMNGTATDITNAQNNLILDTDYDITNAKIINEYNIVDLTSKGVSVDGSMPSSGYVTIMNGTVFDYSLIINGYLINYDETSGALNAQKGGTLDQNSLAIPAIAKLKSCSGLTQDDTASSLGDANYRYLSNPKSIFIKENGTNVEYLTIGIMRVTDSSDALGYRIKLIRKSALSNQSSMDLINTYLNGTFKNTLTDFTDQDIATKYYNGTLELKYLTDFPNAYKEERYNRLLLNGNYVYSSPITPTPYSVGLMYATDCMQAGWLNNYGLTYTKADDTNYYSCGSSLSAVAVSTATNFHPVIYLPTNTVLSGTCATSFIATYIK